MWVTCALGCGCGHHDETIVGRMRLDMHDVLRLARAALIRVRVRVKVRVRVRVRVGLGLGLGLGVGLRAGLGL